MPPLDGVTSINIELQHYTKKPFSCIVGCRSDLLGRGVDPAMVMGVTIAAAVLIAVLLIASMFYVTKKGYSRKWDEE